MSQPGELLFDLVRTGNVSGLKENLKARNDITGLNKKQRSLVHCACLLGNQEIALEILKVIFRFSKSLKISRAEEKLILLDLQDEDGDTALHIAAGQYYSEVVKQLVLRAANVNLRNKKGVEPMQMIYKCTPTVIPAILQTAVKHESGEKFEDNLVLKFEFGKIIGHLPAFDNSSFPIKISSASRDTWLYRAETSLLSYCLGIGFPKRSIILEHPVVQLFMRLKWIKVRKFMIASLFFHLIWTLVYSLFTNQLYHNACPVNETLFVVNTSAANFFNFGGSGLKCDLAPISLKWLDMCICILLIMFLLLSIQQAFVAWTTHWRVYLFKLRTYVQLLFLLIVMITAAPYLTKTRTLVILYPVQYKLAAVGIVLSWGLLLRHVGKFPEPGIYIEIFWCVARSFLLFMVTFASLLIGFVLAFRILVPGMPQYSSVMDGLLKLLLMMAGEFEYDEIFFGSKVPSFAQLSKLVYVAVVVIVTILLFNLLIALAVSNTEKLLAHGEQMYLSSQLEETQIFEAFLLMPSFQKFLKLCRINTLLTFLLVTQQGKLPDLNLSTSVSIKDVPSRLRASIIELTVSQDNVDQLKKSSIRSN